MTAWVCRNARDFGAAFFTAGPYSDHVVRPSLMQGMVCITTSVSGIRPRVAGDTLIAASISDADVWPTNAIALDAQSCRSAISHDNGRAGRNRHARLFTHCSPREGGYRALLERTGHSLTGRCTPSALVGTLSHHVNGLARQSFPVVEGATVVFARAACGGADAANGLVHRRAAQHQVGSRCAEARAIEQDRLMRAPGVLTAQLQAMRRRCRAGGIRVEAITTAFLHRSIHLLSRSL